MCTGMVFQHAWRSYTTEWVLLEIRKVRPKCYKDAYPDKRLSFPIKACDCRIIYFSAMQTQIGNI